MQQQQQYTIVRGSCIVGRALLECGDDDNDDDDRYEGAPPVTRARSFPIRRGKNFTIRKRARIHTDARVCVCAKLFRTCVCDTDTGRCTTHDDDDGVLAGRERERSAALGVFQAALRARTESDSY